MACRLKKTKIDMDMIRYVFLYFLMIFSVMIFLPFI